jgi:hypothetical protein
MTLILPLPLAEHHRLGPGGSQQASATASE